MSRTVKNKTIAICHLTSVAPKQLYHGYTLDDSLYNTTEFAQMFNWGRKQTHNPH